MVGVANARPTRQGVGPPRQVCSLDTAYRSWRSSIPFVHFPGRRSALVSELDTGTSERSAKGLVAYAELWRHLGDRSAAFVQSDRMA